MDVHSKDMENTGFVSSENVSGWTFVDKLECGQCGDASESAPQISFGGAPSPFPDGQMETPGNGTASPTSERAADIVLSQEITDLSSELAYQHPPVPSGVLIDKEIRDQQPGSSDPLAQNPIASKGLSTHGSVVKETSALGAVLAITERQIQQQSAAAMAAVSSWLASLGEMLGNAAEEAQAEWEELSRLVSLAVDQAKTQVEDTRLRMGKVLNNMTPSWTLVSLGAVTTVAVVAMGALWMINRKLAQQVRVRDKELASLVVRILNLQETLRRPGSVTSGPLICHTAMVMPPAAPFCSYTVNGWA